MRETEEKRRERRGESNLLQGASFNEELFLRTNGKKRLAETRRERKDYSVRRRDRERYYEIGKGRGTDGAPR